MFFFGLGIRCLYLCQVHCFVEYLSIRSPLVKSLLSSRNSRARILQESMKLTCGYMGREQINFERYSESANLTDLIIRNFEFSKGSDLGKAVEAKPENLKNNVR